LYLEIQNRLTYLDAEVLEGKAFHHFMQRSYNSAFSGGSMYFWLFKSKHLKDLGVLKASDAYKKNKIIGGWRGKEVARINSPSRRATRSQSKVQEVEEEEDEEVPIASSSKIAVPKERSHRVGLQRTYGSELGRPTKAPDA
jgi:hypothetical protein